MAWIGKKSKIILCQSRKQLGTNFSKLTHIFMSNESELWDRKYVKSREYLNLEDLFRFCGSNATLKEILPFIQNNKDFKILEVGSGTGELISFIKHKNPNLQAFGLDFSEESIRRSKEISLRFNLSVEFERGDISKMSFPNESFDIVFGDQVLGHIEDVGKALQEIYRVTKKGGLVAFSIGNALRPDGWYLNTKLSRNHQGYMQKNMFPWTLQSVLIRS